MGPSEAFSSGKDANSDLWYVDNYVLLKDYYDRTISRIAARCVRSGNIAMEEYPFYGYILDVLEEISETGDYILSHPNTHQYVEKKIAGGIGALKKNLNEFKTELRNNSSPDMIKQDKDELKKMKEALGTLDKSEDPTNGAGMSMDEVINKLMKQNDIEPNQFEPQPENLPQPKPRPQPMQPPRPQEQVAQQRSPQPAQPHNPNPNNGNV